jgi:hypothetical protein
MTIAPIIPQRFMVTTFCCSTDVSKRTIGNDGYVVWFLETAPGTVRVARSLGSATGVSSKASRILTRAEHRQDDDEEDQWRGHRPRPVTRTDPLREPMDVAGLASPPSPSAGCPVETSGADGWCNIPSPSAPDSL